jgi:hypothetical protein
MRGLPKAGAIFKTSMEIIYTHGGFFINAGQRPTAITNRNRAGGAVSHIGDRARLAACRCGVNDFCSPRPSV